MTNVSRDVSLRWVGLVLAGLTLILVTLFGAGNPPDAAAHAQIGAQAAGADFLEHHVSIGAGRRLGSRTSTNDSVLTTSAAADLKPDAVALGLSLAPECDYVSAPSGYDGQVRRVHSCTVANGEAVGRKATAVSTGRHSGVLLHRSVAVSLFGVAAKAGTGRVGTLLQSGERGSLRLPGSGGLDLRGLSTKQAEKFLKQFDTDPHAFKEEFVGRGSISKFDIKMGPGGELHLASKDGSVVIPTGVIPR